MPTLLIGRTEILYEVRRSATASQRRITVTPGGVEVIALSDDDDDAIAGFLARKREWVFNTVREMERTTAGRHSVPRFMTGSKIPFRGRKMSLTVRRSDSERIDIAYQNGFFVDLPGWVTGDSDRLIATELKLWLKQRARHDVNETVDRYRAKYDLSPRTVRVADFENGWGSCGPEGNILINWHLIFAPRKVLDYVVGHEMAHLRYRSHGREFWDYVAMLAPDWDAAKTWLDRQQLGLSADFLNI